MVAAHSSISPSAVLSTVSSTPLPVTLSIEQFVDTTLNSVVFANNDAQTWNSVVATINNYLQTLANQNLLAYIDGYQVTCGLGTTMTSDDILDGYMIVQVTYQPIVNGKISGFIEQTFTQEMGGY